MADTHELTLADLVTQLRDVNARARVVSEDFERSLLLMDEIAVRLRALVTTTEDALIQAVCLDTPA